MHDVPCGTMCAASLFVQWAVDAPWSTMMHDCGLTATYAVILHMPLLFGKTPMMKGGMPFELRKDLPARIGLLRRDAPSAH